MKVIETHPREIGFVLWGHCQNLLDDPRIYRNCTFYSAVMFTETSNVKTPRIGQYREKQMAVISTTRGLWAKAARSFTHLPACKVVCLFTCTRARVCLWLPSVHVCMLDCLSVRLVFFLSLFFLSTLTFPGLSWPATSLCSSLLKSRIVQYNILIMLILALLFWMYPFCILMSISTCNRIVLYCSVSI